MFRRLAAPATRSLQRRSYFYSGGGEDGISGATQKFMNNCIIFGLGAAYLLIYKVIFGYYSPKQQWVADSTDLWEDDGTKMEGEEAVANIRIQRERIMPFMDEIKRQMEDQGVEA